MPSGTGVNIVVDRAEQGDAAFVAGDGGQRAKTLLSDLFNLPSARCMRWRFQGLPVRFAIDRAGLWCGLATHADAPDVGYPGALSNMVGPWTKGQLPSVIRVATGVMCGSRDAER